jgi:ABC-type uncharacterized transport system permease subunit
MSDDVAETGVAEPEPPLAGEQQAADEFAPPERRGFLHRIVMMNTVLLSFLAVVSALIIGAFVIALSDIDALKSGDFGGIADTIWTAYKAIPIGAFGSLRGISETLLATTPLLITGLAVTLSFRAGLFNIGATGQMLIGGMCAVWVGFTMHGPGIIQIPLGLLAGVVGGAAWGAIPGVLKAYTGASEVITTIMTNYIASYLVLWLLKTDEFQRPGRDDPISKDVNIHGRLPRLFGFLDRPATELRVHIGFFIALAMAVLVWWVLSRTTKGFEFRALGANADAARYAGMSPAALTVLVMVLSGALAGLAGGTEVLGTQFRATQTFAGDIGFDAIAVSLLGRTTPLGTALAAFLFGVLQAGGQRMQLDSGVPIDLILVLRALIVLFIAAPLLIRWIWRIKPEGEDVKLSFKGSVG